MKTMADIACVAVLVLGGSAWAQQWVGGPGFDTSGAVTATSPNGSPDAVPTRVVDGSGLDETGEMHDTRGWEPDPTSAWLGQGNNQTPADVVTPNPGTYTSDTNPNWIRFDFDQVHALGRLRVWNYNGELPGRGMRMVAIEYSATGGEDPDQWVRLGGEDFFHEFEEATGTTDYTGFIAADFNGAEARHVVFTVQENLHYLMNHTASGNVGLSEVRFYLPGGRCEPGDADGDGDVDDNDLSWLLANWGQNTDCGHGEFSGVPPVNDDDLSLLLANWTGPLPAAVPEPAAPALLAVVALASVRRCRRPMA